MAIRQPSRRRPTPGPIGIDRPKPKPKKQRGYGQASDGRTRKSTGGVVNLKLPSNIAKPN